MGPAMPMMNNGAVPPPAIPRPQQQIDNKHLLNTYIYEYFLRNEMYDCARAILNSDPQIKVQDGPNTRRDENGNLLGNGVGDGSMDVDSKDGIDTKRPEDLPQPSIPNPSMDNPFLYEWFCLFWDMFNAQKGRSSNGQVNSYMNHTQVCAIYCIGTFSSVSVLTICVESIPPPTEPTTGALADATGHDAAAAANTYVANAKWYEHGHAEGEQSAPNSDGQ